MRHFVEKLSAFYDRRGAVCLGAAAFLLMILILFGGRTIGLSDNGDYKRVMDASSLRFDGDDGAFAFDNTYIITLTEQSAAGNILKILFGAEGWQSYPSLQVPVVRISVVLNLFLNKLTGGDMTMYRIEVLGLLHCVLYAAVIMFLMAQFRLKKRLLDIVAKILILIVLCDVGYLTYFNSFYGEGLQLISLVFLAAMLIRVVTAAPRLSDAFLCALGCIVLGWSKFFNIPASCFAALLLFGILLKKTKRKAHAAAGIATLCVLAAVYITIPPWMSLQTKFNAVFFGALKDADAASCQQYLDELDLPREFVRYRNTNIYVEGIALELEENGHDKDIMAVSNFDIAAFYLRHPDRLLHAMTVSLLNTGSIRPFYLSNYNNAAPKLTFSYRFSLWSDVRVAAGFDSLAGAAGVILAFIVTVLVTMKRFGRKWYEMLFVLLLSAGLLAYFFIVPFMSNGEGDLAKHLFAYMQLNDLMVLFVLTLSLGDLNVEKARLIPCGCLVMALCLAVPPLKAEITHFSRLSKPYGSPEAGAYISLGAYAGKALIWQVAETEGGLMTLLCDGLIESAPFSEDGGNNWEASALRTWLNTEFLAYFSENERERLLPISNTVLLSRELKDTAASGSRDFYFSPVPILASRGYSESYQTVTRDTVTLPDIGLITELAQDGVKLDRSEAYWLETPYFNNGYMVRCVMPDGRILMREAAERSGIRPVICLSSSVSASGTGTYADPFTLH